MILLFADPKTDAVISAMLELHLRLASGGSHTTNDEIVCELAESIQSKLPVALDIEEAGKAMFEGRLKGCGLRDLGNQCERTRSVVRVKHSTQVIPKCEEKRELFLFYFYFIFLY